jgi:hypothetical protein
VLATIASTVHGRLAGIAGRQLLLSAHVVAAAAGRLGGAAASDASAGGGHAVGGSGSSSGTGAFAGATGAAATTGPLAQHVSSGHDNKPWDLFGKSAPGSQAISFILILDLLLLAGLLMWGGAKRWVVPRFV